MAKQVWMCQECGRTYTNELIAEHCEARHPEFDSFKLVSTFFAGPYEDHSLGLLDASTVPLYVHIELTDNVVGHINRAVYKFHKYVR